MNTSGDPGGTGDRWTIVVPVKSLDRAKSRLAPALSPRDRRTLVVAMATDVITACRSAAAVDRVRVVGSDPEVARLAQDLGAEFVVDPATATDASDPRPSGLRPVDGDPLNTAIDWALTGVRGPVGVIAADLPELDGRILTGILDSASRHPHSVVTDHRGHGSTMAFWTGSSDRVSRFGVDSAARFRQIGGAVEIVTGHAGRGSATRDVDVPEDITGLSGRPVGPATRRTLEGVPDTRPCRDAEESVTIVR